MRAGAGCEQSDRQSGGQGRRGCRETGEIKAAIVRHAVRRCPEFGAGPRGRRQGPGSPGLRECE
ncbi:hypothetical protein D9X30_5705 [Cupriavidus sp. U2]|nr:hypothetical protein D9X30_5705 [Cupriavidus sp. U2]